MKKNTFLRNVVLAGILALMPLSLPAKGVAKVDETIKDCTMPDGTVCDLNLFKTEDKFKKDRDANLTNVKNYKQLRLLTKEETLAWKESKTPVEDDEYFLKQSPMSEASFLETMKKKKTPLGSSYTIDGNRIRVIYVLADKTYKTLTYERFYMVERAEDETSGYTVDNVTLPDKTVTDLIMFATTAEYNEFYKEYTSGTLDSYWAAVNPPTPKQFKKIYDPEGSITMPGFIAKHYSLAKLGDLGKLMKEKQFAVAAFAKETGTGKCQTISIEVFDETYELFLYKKIDHVLKDKSYTTF